MMLSLRDKLKAIRLLVSDVDGIWTDGTLLYGPDGEAFKLFNVLDGQGVKALRKNGVEVAVVSAKKSLPLMARLKDLGVELAALKTEEKLPAVDRIRKNLGLSWDEVAYVGDDVVDVQPLKKSGVGISVPNGYQMAREAADLVLNTPGGQGALREVADLILSAKMDLVEAYNICVPL